MYAIAIEKMPGETSPCTNRQKINCGSVTAVDASAVAIASANADATIVRRNPKRSATRPTIGAAMATASVGAVTVRLTAKLDAWNVRARSGSSGCVA